MTTLTAPAARRTRAIVNNTPVASLEDALALLPEVKAEPIFDADMQQIPGHKRVFSRDKEGKTYLHQIGKSSYCVIGNERAAKVFHEAVSGVFDISSLYHSPDFGRICLNYMPKEGGSVRLSNGDEFKGFFNALWGHDADTSLAAATTSFRVICRNTHRKAMKAAFCTLRHTSNADARLEGFEAAIAQHFATFKEEMENMELMLEKALGSADAAAAFAAGLIGSTETKGRNIASAIAGLAATGIGNKGQTRYDLFNGVTEYYDHHTNPNRADSNVWGSYAKMKEKAHRILLDDEAFGSTLEAGRRILAAA